MSHVRKDTLVKPPEWWKHLRPYLKRRLSKQERAAAKREVIMETCTIPPRSKLACNCGGCKDSFIPEEID